MSKRGQHAHLSEITEKSIGTGDIAVGRRLRDIIRSFVSFTYCEKYPQTEKRSCFVAQNQFVTSTTTTRPTTLLRLRRFSFERSSRSRSVTARATKKLRRREYPVFSSEARLMKNVSFLQVFFFFFESRIFFGCTIFQRVQIYNCSNIYGSGILILIQYL